MFETTYEDASMRIHLYLFFLFLLVKVVDIFCEKGRYCFLVYASVTCNKSILHEGEKLLCQRLFVYTRFFFSSWHNSILYLVISIGNSLTVLFIFSCILSFLFSWVNNNDNDNNNNSNNNNNNNNNNSNSNNDNNK